jgi:hypothetical protein
MEPQVYINTRAVSYYAGRASRGVVVAAILGGET